MVKNSKITPKQHPVSGPRPATDPMRSIHVRRNIRVVPLLVGGVAMLTEDDLPPSLKPLAFRAGTAIRPDPGFHRDIDRLMGGLRAE